jgi:ankyrin repeat protein
MGNSSSTPSGRAKGEEFIEKLLYVQHVDENKDTASETSERYLEEYLLADRTNFADSNFTKYLWSPKENLSILKSSMEDVITGVTIYSNPLPIPLWLPGITFHAFVVFKTHDGNLWDQKREGRKKKEKWAIWWSLEKNGKYIVLQQSPNKDDVINKIYDTKQNESIKRFGQVTGYESDEEKFLSVKDLLEAIWGDNQFKKKYNLWTSNCQHFTSFIYENITGKKWSTTMVNQFGSNEEIQPGINVGARKYNLIINNEKFDYYRALMEGRREDFEQMTNDLTSDSLNSVDSQGYTLLEWATVFSTSHWPIAEELKKKGAQIPLDEGLFRRNVYFIAMQYLPNTKNPKSSDSADDINKTGGIKALPYLYGEKWDIVEKILNQFEDDDFNTINSQGDTPLHLAAKLKCEIGLFKKILNRTNPKNINKTDRNGWTALHSAIDKKSKTKVKELLKHKDVDVNVKNDIKHTPLHLASSWEDIPMDLFKLILEKSKEINAQDKGEYTALHYAILYKSEMATKALLTHEDVDDKVKNNKNETALHLASYWKDIPVDLFNFIFKKSTNLNAQNFNGHTAFHLAIFSTSEIATKALLTHEDVDVNIKNNYNETALHLASKWTDIPVDLFKIILEKSKEINSQDIMGDTALHYAILRESEIATKELLVHSDVDVNVKNYNNNETALHLACKWKDMPMDLFKFILEKSTDVINAQDDEGWTALHYAIQNPKFHSKIHVEELLKHKDVNVNVENNIKRTPLHLACYWWKDIPADLFQIILEKSTDINAHDRHGNTALHYAIIHKSEIAVKGLLAHSDVNVNIKNKDHETALHLVSMWKDIPSDLFKLISERSTNDEVKKNSKMDRLFKYLRNLTVHK